MENEKNMKLAENFIDRGYVEIGQEALNSFSAKVRSMLAQRRLGDEGMEDREIEHLMLQLSAMDTNNFDGKIGVGEREGRIFSDLVQKRNYYMGHGIGRSGTVNAAQPKAPGSSLLLQMTKFLVMDVFRNGIGLGFISDLLIVPAATGMSLTLCLLTLSKQKPKATHVIISRIDQKTCLKSITAANLTPIVVEPKLQGAALTTDIKAMTERIETLGSDSILCVFSTTSCFAPRHPDDVEIIAMLCKDKDIHHIINNAYGIQCSKINEMMIQSHKKGRVDLVVQSTDKNFMVPVGGSIVFSSNAKLIEEVGKIYPGRASMGPIMDLFITLLSMGKRKYLELIKERKENFVYFKSKLTEVLESKGEKVLETPNNRISIAFTIGQLCKKDKFGGDATFFGSYLYKRRVMGARVVSNTDLKLEGILFKNYGSHCEAYPDLPYITVASAIGSSRKEIDEFIEIIKKL